MRTVGTSRRKTTNLIYSTNTRRVRTHIRVYVSYERELDNIFPKRKTPVWSVMFDIVFTSRKGLLLQKRRR
jgi:hypothetical protein